MWQIEDLIRANGCDSDKINDNIVSRYPEEERAELTEWYANLIEMMRIEGVMESGHLQINRNVILSMTDLHAALSVNPLAFLQCPDCDAYRSLSGFGLTTEIPVEETASANGRHPL